MNILSNHYRSTYLVLLFVLVVAFYPVVATIPFILGVTSTPVSISYRAGYLGLSLLLILFTITQSRKIVISAGAIPLFLFFILYILRLYYDLVFRDIDVYESDAYFFQYAIGGTFIPLIAAAIGWVHVDTTRLVQWVYYFSLISCCAIFIMVVSGGGFIEALVASRIRVSNEEASIVGPIILSREGGVLANLSLFYLLRKYPRSPLRFLLIISLGLGLLLLIAGASRGPLFATLIIILIQLVIAFWTRLQSTRFWIYLTALMLFLIVPGLYYLIFKTDLVDQLTIFNRLSSFSVSNFQEEVRAQQWEAAWLQIKSSPIWGERMVENLFGHSPHNLFIEIQLALGFIGSLLFLLAFSSTLMRFVGELKVNSSYVIIHLLLWLYLLFGMTGISIHTSPQIWLLLIAATYASSTLKKKKQITID